MFKNAKNGIARIQTLVKKSAYTHKAPIIEPSADLPDLTTAHLSDENGLPIDSKKQVIAPPIYILEKILKKNDGLVLGRLKRSFSDVEFLTANMSIVAKLGVTKFFCNFIEARDQAMLDRYYSGEEIASEIRNYINDKYGAEQHGMELVTRVELYMRVIRATKRHGIRAIAIDVPSDENSPISADSFMAGIIKQYNAIIPGKSIVCAGAVA